MQTASAMAPRGTRQEDIRAVEQLNIGYIRSVATSDVAWFSENLSENFLNSNADSSLVDRAGFLKQIAQPATVSDFKCEDVRIRLFGDMAIVHGRTIYNKADGQAGAGRYTDTYCVENGRWVCVAAHVTRG